MGVPVSIHCLFLPPSQADEILQTMLNDPTWSTPRRVVAGRDVEPKRLQKWMEDGERGDDSPTCRSSAFQEALRAVARLVNEERERRGISSSKPWRPTYWIGNNYRGACDALHGEEVIEACC